MNHKCLLLFTFYLLLSLYSCSDDDAYVPSYRTDLVFAYTDQDSIVNYILMDDGKRYDVNSQKIVGVAPNARIRCYTSFSIGADSADVMVYEMKRISFYAPLPADSFDIHPQDPLNVTSVWRSGDYINLCLAPLVSSFKDFQYDFCIDSITHSVPVSETGSKKTVLHTSLLFKRPKYGSESYTHKFYHTIPLYSDDYACDFDSLYLYINTYDGMKRFCFER